MPLLSTRLSSARERGPITGALSIERVIEVRVYAPELVEMQANDLLLDSVRTFLLGHSNEELVADIDSYISDDWNLLWRVRNQKPSLAIPKRLVLDLLVLVHSQHGHPGVEATTVLLRDQFYSPQLARNTRDCVLPYGCRHRTRVQSQKVPVLPAKFYEPREVVEIYFGDMRIAPSPGNRYLLLLVDKALGFLFAHPTKTKETYVGANHLLDLCLTFGIPACIHSDRVV